MPVQSPSVRTIFERALDLPAAERAAFLDEACADNTELRTQVDALLTAHFDAGSFLEPPSHQLERTTFQPQIAEQPGTTIGPYKLLQQIGEGGMGVVFMAEQSEPIQRTVALKIIKPGMDSRQVIARFEAERQALAMMDHPNIAKVHDAGTTEIGRPYFVMELVQGVPITEYCDQCNLTTRERLQLFVLVCRAVQHAHQKGIIHRDIKPTNVLIAIQDGRPAPKIIDFGVAKAINQQLTEYTQVTAFAQIVGTPLYMSPEQAELSRLGIDTRSDIYSLGVVLYELLTGSTPYDKDRLHAVPYDEMRRILREEEPPRPSDRVSTLAADLATTVAQQRRTDVRRLQQSIRGELDWIVMKCLEKERNRRYETPNSLARDIERYLHDEAVQACPPSVAYRLKKFVRRNKVVAVFVALMLLSVAGLAISNVAIKRERDAKSKALAEANAISNFLFDMLASSSPDGLKGPKYTVRELLDEFSSRLSGQLDDQPEVEAAIRTAIGKSYWRLGENEIAEPHLAKAVDLRRRIPGTSDDRVADSLIDHALNLGELDRFAETENCVQEAISIYWTQKHKPHVANAMAEAFYFLALAQLQRGDKAGYHDTCRKLNELPELPQRFGDVSNMARPIWTPCLAPAALDDMSGPVRRAEELLASNTHDQRHFRLFMLGAALYRHGQFKQAAQRLKDSIAVYPATPRHGFDTLNYQRLLLAMSHWRLGQQDEARRLLDETLLPIKQELASPLTEWVRRATFELLRREAGHLIRQDRDDESEIKANPPPSRSGSGSTVIDR